MSSQNLIAIIKLSLPFPTVITLLVKQNLSTPGTGKSFYSDNFDILQKCIESLWHRGMLSGSGSGNPSLDPGKGEKIINIYLLFQVRFCIVVMVQ